MSCVVRALWKKLVIAGTGFEISFHHSFGVVCVRVTTGLKGGEGTGLKQVGTGKKEGLVVSFGVHRFPLWGIIRPHHSGFRARAQFTAGGLRIMGFGDPAMRLWE